MKFNSKCNFKTKAIVSIVLVFSLSLKVRGNERNHIFSGGTDSNIKKLRVLVVAGIFPRLPQRYVVNQIVGLIKDGHDVSIHAKRKGETKQLHEDVLTYKLMSKLYIDKLPQDIEKMDIILCEHGHYGVQFLKIKKRKKLQAKLVTFFRGGEIWGFADDRPGFYDELFQEGDLFLTNCEAFRQRAIELGCPPQKIHVNFSSINLKNIHYKERNPNFKKKINILTAGRLVDKKGTSDVIAAVALLKKKYPNIHYTIAGDGPLRRELENQVKELELEKMVTFLGSYTSTELPKILNNSDIFLAPSVTPKGYRDKDALTNTIKEAMANGLPIITTNHGGIPEFIKHQENGLLVEEYDVVGLAEQIETLIKNTNLIPLFGKKGRLLVEENFEMSKKNEELILFLKKITNDESYRSAQH